MEVKMMEERNEEIVKIVQSINSLNTIYKELQTLVIHQGSLLDRIDENIENTFVHVQKANEHLE
jgi:syntaxin 16